MWYMQNFRFLLLDRKPRFLHRHGKGRDNLNTDLCRLFLGPDFGLKGTDIGAPGGHVITLDLRVAGMKTHGNALGRNTKSKIEFRKQAPEVRITGGGRKQQVGGGGWGRGDQKKRPVGLNHREGSRKQGGGLKHQVTHNEMLK